MTIRAQVREFLTLAISDLARTHRPRRGLHRRSASSEQLEVRALLATFTVTNLNDSGAGSLRDAITQSNIASGSDTIAFQSGLTGTIVLTSGSLFVSDSLSINGPGAGQLAISGGGSNFGVMIVDDARSGLFSDVSISGLTVRDGGNGTTALVGAGIFSRENLTLNGVALLNNNAGTAGGGGGLQIFAGTLRMQDCTVAGNKAGQGGGIELSTDAISGDIVNCTISGNEADRWGGGVLVVTGTTSIRNSTITANRANVKGTEPNTSGGGVYGNLNGTVEFLTLHNCIVAGNTWGAGVNQIAEDIGDTIHSSSSFNLIGNATSAGGLSNGGPNGNIIGLNGAGTRDISTILNTTLASNGGPTQTHALVAASPAINAGSNARAVDANGVALSRDQRGSSFPRRFGNVDIGAVEFLSVTGPTVVDTAVDEDDGNLSSGDVSLREAIALANLSPGANTITFAATINTQPINMSGNQMTISETLTITGNGAANTIIDGQQRGTGILGITSGDVTLNSLTIRNGSSSTSGGAIRSTSNGSLTINSSILSGNSTTGLNANGGAIHAGSGAVTINSSTLSGNSSSSSSSGSSRGGAIYAQSGAVTISQSTLSGNSVTTTVATSISRGGAIFAFSGAVTISQSTLSGNSATATGTNSISGGGAIYAFSGAVTISQSTLSGNSATATGTNSISRGGAIHVFSGAAKTIRNSIVAGNTGVDGTDMFISGSDPTVTNSLIGRSSGTGLTATVGTTPDANGNFIGGSLDATKIDPKLGPLANNGGPTQTHALLTGSLAIDRGSDANAVDVTNGNAPLTGDQRGVTFLRFRDGDHSGVAPNAARVDMGAFEFFGSQLLSPGQNSVNIRPTFTWTAIEGATSYRIQVNNDSTNTANVVNTTVTTPSFTPSANLGIGRYRMWIQPIFGAAGTPGNWGPPQTFGIVTPPTWATMSRTQLTSRPTLTWNALPGAVKYDLWGSNFSTGQQQTIRLDVTGTSFTPTTDLPMGIHRFWIRGVDGKGNFAGWSVLQELQVVPGPTPVGPLSATFDRTPTFSWNPVAGAASYELYVRNTNTGAMAINGTSVTGTSFTPSTNLVDGPYRWWTIAVSPVFGVGATASAIKSGGSNPVDLYVGGRPTMTSPTNNSSTADRTPTFTWRAVDGAVRYELLVNRINVTQKGIINQTSLTTTTFTPATDLPAGTYRAWVRAVSATNEVSIYSVQVDFTITDLQPGSIDLDPAYLLAELLPSHFDDDESVAPKSKHSTRNSTVKTTPATQPDDVQDSSVIDQLALLDAVMAEHSVLSTDEFVVSFWRAAGRQPSEPSRTDLPL